MWKVLSKHSKKHDAVLSEIFKESKELFDSDKMSKYSESQIEKASIFKFIKKIMLELEVVDQDKKRLMIYFPKLPECFQLSNEDKKNYMEDCDISDSNTKMLDIQRNFKMFCIQMEMNTAAFRRSQLMYRLISKDSFAVYLRFIWTFGLIINLFAAFWVDRDEDGTLATRTSAQDLAIKIMGLVLSGCSVFLLIFWMFYSYPQQRRIDYEDFKFDNPGANPDTLSSWIKINIFKSFLSKPLPVNMILHILFTLFGIFRSYFSLAMNLLLVVNISRTCRFVMNAITLHADQLVLTLVMAFFVVHCYTTLMAEYFYDALDLPSPDPLVCETLSTCFVYMVNQGLRNGGGIGDSMKPEPLGDRFFAKNIYELTFFIIINVISLNIIFGVIIDTFSQLRDEQQERSKYMFSQPN